MWRDLVEDTLRAAVIALLMALAFLALLHWYGDPGAPWRATPDRDHALITSQGGQTWLR
jgi:hypothetical protein